MPEASSLLLWPEVSNQGRLVWEKMAIRAEPSGHTDRDSLWLFNRGRKRRERSAWDADGVVAGNEHTLD
jgi:hypothetical protein